MSEKIAIVGSRNFRYLNRVKEFVATLPADCTVVSGGAQGVDSVAVSAAKECGMGWEVFWPDTQKYPPTIAPLMRNTQIVDFADRIIAFWDGRSGGTKDTIRKAEKIGKPVEIIYEDQYD